MKILLSEAQIIHLLKEAYGKEVYIDTLLDKMAGRGLSALSDKEREDLEKMSRGEHIDFGNSEPEITSGTEMAGTEIPPQDMFMEMIPNKLKFRIGNEDWKLIKEVDPDGEHDILLITNDTGKSYVILPFHNGNEFSVMGVMKEYKFKTKKSPKSEEEMASFITEFINKDLSVIVQYIKTKE